MAQPDDLQYNDRQISSGNVYSRAIDRYGNREGNNTLPHAMSRTYPAINLGDQAHAILGDVNISRAGPVFLQHADPFYHKRTLLRSLYFESMSTRKAQIDARAGSPKYVEWVWKTSFPAWLESPDSFYWITGRPGSGKSTLMTHISSSYKTKQALTRRGGQWKIVHFFFDFRAGRSLGNNIEGLLRSLLYQIVRQVPEVTEYIDSDPSHDSVNSWSTQTCLENLCDAFEASSYSICAFIDGLDEYDGSYTELIDVIQSIGERVSRIKLCLASRPYPSFQNSLGGFTSITMQDYNDESIRMYTSAQWSDRRIDHRAQLPQDLSDRIRTKAKGVFLWARLAVDELLIDFVAGKPVAELYDQLETMPAKVEAMYLRILERLSEPHQQEAAAILYIINQSEGPIAIDQVYATVGALMTHRWVGRSILPIGNNTENASRLLAILGDLTDQTDLDEQEDEYGISSRLIIEDSTIRCERDGTIYVSLTHETLRSFLAKSSWFLDKTSPQMVANTGNIFWINLYLTEISVRMLTHERDYALEAQILSSAAKYRSTLNELFVRDWKTLVYGIKFFRRRSETEYTIIEAELLKLLGLWQAWSPFLLFAIQYLPDKLHKLGPVRKNLANRIMPLCESLVFPLHGAICMFKSLERYRFEIEFRGDDGDAHWSRYSCASQLLASQLRAATPESIDSSRLEPIFVAMGHKLEDLAPLFITGMDLNENMRRLIFDFVWEYYISHLEDDNELPEEHLMEFLISTGCYLEPRHFCSMRKYCGAERELHPGPAKFVSEHMLRSDLSHAPNCPFSQQGPLGFIRELESIHFSVDKDCRIFGRNDPHVALLRALFHRGAGLNETNPAMGETLLVEQIRSILACDNERDLCERLEWFHVLLNGGADPHQRGESGDAFMVASRFYDNITKSMDASIVAAHKDCDCFECHISDTGDGDKFDAILRILKLLEKYKGHEDLDG